MNCTSPAPTVGPSWSSVDYKATQEASLSVGGSVTAATEAKLFGIIGSKISIKVEAEHEWTETNSFNEIGQGLFGAEKHRNHLDSAHDRHGEGDLGAQERVGDVHRHQFLADTQWGDRGR